MASTLELMRDNAVFEVPSPDDKRKVIKPIEPGERERQWELETLHLDEVTGGYNRRHLMNMLELEMARKHRSEQPLGVVMFDLDNFKRVNDTNGHIAGDAVLRHIFNAASETLREIDTLARYGGDEFVIILPGADADSIYEAATRVRAHVLESLRQHFPYESLESQVTLSLGAISIDNADDLAIESVIERADAQLYKAKRAGKDQVCAA